MANLLSMAKIDAILTLHQRKWSIRRIANELGIHRDTVTRYLQRHEQQTIPATPEGGASQAKIRLIRLMRILFREYPGS